MTAAAFEDLVGARDLTIDDDTWYTTPGPIDCPNSDPATYLASTGNAYRNDTPGELMIPWGVSDWSLEMWLYRPSTDTGATSRLLLYGDTGGVASGSWPAFRQGVVYNGTDIIFQIHDGLFTVVAQKNIPRPASDTWGYYVWTVNSSLGVGAASGRRIKGYKDGSASGSDTAFTSSFSNTVPTNARLWTGIDQVPAVFSMAKLAVYHREITSTEVSDHYLAMTT